MTPEIVPTEPIVVVTSTVAVVLITLIVRVVPIEMVPQTGAIVRIVQMVRVVPVWSSATARFRVAGSPCREVAMADQDTLRACRQQAEY